VVKVSEQHPQKQGLKLHREGVRPILRDVSEQHPQKQGLKHLSYEVDTAVTEGSQSNIHKNKD